METTTTTNNNYEGSPYGLAFLPDNRRMVVVCVGLVSCILSLYGSVTLVWLICRRVLPQTKARQERSSRSRRRSEENAEALYHRLILGLSAFDIINTTGYLLSPFFLPFDTELKWAVGNRTTCTMSGVFNQFVIGSYVYNAVLSCYYLALIRYNWRPSQSSAAATMWWEPAVHMLALALPLIQSVPSAVLGGMNAGPLLGMCAQYPHPYECYRGLSQEHSSLVPCTRGVNAAVTTVGNVMVAFTVIFAVTAVVATWMVWWTVRQQLRRNRRYAVDWQQQEQGEHGINSGSNQTQPPPLMEIQQKRLQAVATQCICYTGAVVNLLFWFGVGSALEGHYHRKGTLDGSTETDLVELLRDDTGYFCFMILFWVLFPLQGLYNWIIYLRPRLVRWKDAHPELSWCGAYQQVLSGKPVPTTNRTAHLTKMYEQCGQQGSNSGGSGEDVLVSGAAMGVDASQPPSTPTGGGHSSLLRSSVLFFGLSRSSPEPQEGNSSPSEMIPDQSSQTQAVITDNRLADGAPPDHNGDSG